MCSRLCFPITSDLRIEQSLSEETLRVTQVAATQHRIGSPDSTEELGVPISTRCCEAFRLLVRLLCCVEFVQLAQYARGPEPTRDPVRLAQGFATDPHHRLEHIERFLQQELVLEVMAVREQGWYDQLYVARAERIGSGVHEPDQMSGLGRITGELSVGPLEGRELVGECVRSHGPQAGVEQVHEPEREEGTVTESRRGS